MLSGWCGLFTLGEAGHSLVGTLQQPLLERAACEGLRPSADSQHSLAGGVHELCLKWILLCHLGFQMTAALSDSSLPSREMPCTRNIQRSLSRVPDPPKFYEILSVHHC